jgi:hypothetical protein
MTPIWLTRLNDVLTAQLAQTVQRPIFPACARAVLPPELRDMLLHD